MNVTIEFHSTFFIEASPCNLHTKKYPGHMETEAPIQVVFSTIYSVRETENASTLINAMSVFEHAIRA